MRQYELRHPIFYTSSLEFRTAFSRHQRLRQSHAKYFNSKLAKQISAFYNKYSKPPLVILTDFVVSGKANVPSLCISMCIDRYVKIITEEKVRRLIWVLLGQRNSIASFFIEIYLSFVCPRGELRFCDILNLICNMLLLMGFFSFSVFGLYLSQEKHLQIFRRKLVVQCDYS